MNTKKAKHQFLILLLSLASISSSAQDTLQVKNAEAILYTGKNNNQPLVVGLGGSEGGNAWAGNHWKKTREEFLQKGYAFLAVGYFGCKGTPKLLDKIAIDEVYNAIAEAKKNKKINKNKIAVIGGSRGADLALLLGSYYPDITAVVGMSSSHAVFPGHTLEFTTSCWTYKGKELPFIPINEEAIPFLMKRDLRRTFETMLKDTITEQKALIKVENINGAILLLSGTKDEIIPAVEMGEKMILRLKKNNFKYPYEHIILEGSHEEPTKHFDKIFNFLQQILNQGNMKNRLTHFAIYIDDIERAKKFYDGVFEWGFNSYGQNDFLQIKADKSENSELIGAMQSRKYSPVPEKIIGLECTISVESIDGTIEKVKKNGGKILVAKTAIPHVGWIAKFLDTEGNLVCAMQYDPAAK